MLFIVTGLCIAYKIIAPPTCNYKCVVQSYFPRENSNKYLTFEEEVEIVEKNNENEIVIWIKEYNILDTVTKKELSTFFIPVNSYKRNPSLTEM